MGMRMMAMLTTTMRITIIHIKRMRRRQPRRRMFMTSIAGISMRHRQIC